MPGLRQRGELSSRPQRTALGVATILVTVLAMAFGDALVKAVSAQFSLWQIYLLRSLLALPLLILLLRGAVRPRAPGWVVLRSLCLLLMWLAFYGALPLTSLAVVAAAFYSGPLFITLFSALLIGEPVTRRGWLAVAVGFLGVLVIVRPGSAAFTPVTLLPVLAALFYALAAVLTRAKCPEESPFVLSLALNLGFLAFGLAGSAVLLGGAPDPALVARAPFLLGPWSPLAGADWLLIGLLALLIVGVSSGMAKAYQCGPPAVIAAFDYAYLPFAVAWGYLFFAELPDALTGLGMALIAGAGLLALGPSRGLRWPRRRRPRRALEPGGRRARRRGPRSPALGPPRAPGRETPP